MSRVTVPPLSEATVIEKGGWHPDHAEVLAIATDGRYGVSIVDGNGDRSELESEIWIFEEGSWHPDSSEGDGPRDFSRPWASGWCGMGGPEDGCDYIYGFGAGYRCVDITILGATRRVSVGSNNFWAFMKARSTTPERSPDRDLLGQIARSHDNLSRARLD
jgi:hypothetical protein